MLEKAQAQNTPFHIAILDMQMPEMDGLTLGKIIMEDERFKALTLVMLTSMGMRGDAQTMEALGFEAYLTKPIKQAQLYDCLAMALGAHTQGPAQARQIITRHTAGETQKIQILLADDNEINQKVAVINLIKMGHSVTVANNGKEALDAIKNGEQYDLILMDGQMPVMDGLEATQKIRKFEADHNIPKTPIVALTAHAMTGDKEKFLEAGMDDYLTKPLKRDALARVISTIATRKPRPTPSPHKQALPEWTPKAEDLESQSPIKAEQTPNAAQDKTIQPMNIQAALDIMGGDQELLDDCLKTFMGDVDQSIGNIAASLDAQDPKALEESAHKYKGTLQYICADTASELAFQLESMGKKEEFSQANAVLNSLETETQRIKEFINNHLH